MSTQSSTAAEPADSPVELADRAVPGWWLNFVAGMVPLLAGLVVLLISWLGVARADAKWWTGLGTLDFSYSDLSAAGSDAPPWVEMLGSVGGVNIVAAAIAVCVVARFGLRNGQRWAWWFLAFCFVWIGLHDAVMTTVFFLATGQPFLLLPYTYCALMLAGLIWTRKSVFARTSDGDPA